MFTTVKLLLSHPVFVDWLKLRNGTLVSFYTFTLVAAWIIRLKEILRHLWAQQKGMLQL